MNEKIFYPNGYGASVISNETSYGGVDGLYELAILIGDEEKWNICYDTSITSDVIGYLDTEQVHQLLEQIQELPVTLRALSKTRDVKIDDICG